jgi:hypothetical protein
MYFPNNSLTLASTSKASSKPRKSKKSSSPVSQQESHCPHLVITYISPTETLLAHLAERRPSSRLKPSESVHTEFLTTTTQTITTLKTIYTTAHQNLFTPYNPINRRTLEEREFKTDVTTWLDSLNDENRATTERLKAQSSQVMVPPLITTFAFGQG